VVDDTWQVIGVERSRTVPEEVLVVCEKTILLLTMEFNREMQAEAFKWLATHLTGEGKAADL
jgi:hypothetical protein